MNNSSEKCDIMIYNITKRFGLPRATFCLLKTVFIMN